MDSFLKAFRLGCLAYYPDELTFRLNREASTSIGSLFLGVFSICHPKIPSRLTVVSLCKSDKEGKFDTNNAIMSDYNR